MNSNYSTTVRSMKNMNYIEQLFYSGTRWIINSTVEYLFLSKLTTSEEIPQTGWKYRNNTDWHNDDKTLMMEGIYNRND